MCQPSKTTGAVHHLTCMQNSSYLPSHMSTHTNTSIHTCSLSLTCTFTHTLTLVTYTHTSHTHMQKSNPVSVHLHAVTTSTNLAITKQMKSSGRISPAPAYVYASECASSLHTHAHAHYLDAFSLSSWLSGVQKTHSLIPALSLCLQHMRRQVLYLIHYSIDWLLAAALTLPCWSLGKRLAEGN